MYRSCIGGLLAGAVALAGVSQAFGGPACRPTLTIHDAHFSQMQPPTLQRKWTAVVSVDAAGCAANADGTFAIGFVRLKEIGLDAEFRERFRWQPPSVKVEVGFWGDEAVGRYWIDSVTSCPCPG